MNSNTNSLMFFNFQTEKHDLYYYITVSKTKLYYCYTCAIFRCPNKIRICLMEILGYSSAA